MPVNLGSPCGCGQSQRFCLLVTAVLLLSLVLPASLYAAESSEAFAILDRCTSTRWGDDNLAWVVHYPKELVDPWVKAEARKRKYSADQTEKYRKDFSDELKIDSASAFLLSVHAYGVSPLVLAPLSQNIVLIDSSGRRVKPIAYEKKLDNPLMGLAQGFVFFPKQRDTNFSVAVKGLKAEGETLFSFPFAGSTGAASIITMGSKQPADDKKSVQTPKQEKEVVIKIPTVSKPQTPSADKPPKPEKPKKLDRSPDAAPEYQSDKEIYAPTVPQKVSPDESLSTAPAAPERPVAPAPVLKKPKQSAKQVLDIYLKAWIQGDTEQMYGLLSSESRSRVSKELFAREVMSGGFREALKRGYKVNWMDGSAKVTVSQKILLMRASKSKVIKFTEEEGSASVAW